jgi:hypothetical protein
MGHHVDCLRRSGNKQRGSWQERLHGSGLAEPWLEGGNDPDDERNNACQV